MANFKYVYPFISSVDEMVSEMWWGVLIGIGFLALLSRVPREFIIYILGGKGGAKGVFRATMAGVLLDMCSHGILFVGAELYKKGASIGQVIAFLIASPWNSFSLTMILIALIGAKWTFTFIALSMVVGILTGIIYDWLVKKGKLPANPNTVAMPENFSFWRDAKAGIKKTSFGFEFFKSAAVSSLHDAQMVLRWLLFGVVAASLIRAFVPADAFGAYFGPTMIGLLLTIIIATILEICSEGSVPIAADIINRAAAPGNGFAFLMTGVATDYTEIMILKEVTKSWKIALFLPLITVPQVVFIAWIINIFS